MRVNIITEKNRGARFKIDWAGLFSLVFFFFSLLKIIFVHIYEYLRRVFEFQRY